MPLEKLKTLAGPEAVSALSKAESDTQLAGALRWVLRGLPPKQALRKVKAGQYARFNGDEDMTVGDYMEREIYGG